MGDYRDIIEAARQSGFTLDACGSSERYYTWGSFIDLCGMSVEEYMKAPAYSGGGGGQGDSSASTKTKNTITLSMQEGSDGTNHIKVSAEKVSDSDVIVSFNVEGVGTQVVTIPAGSKEVVTSISVPDGSKYAVITGAVATGEDERYKYSVKNTIQDGNFTLTVIKDGVKTVETVKYNTDVAIPVLDEKYGYNPVYTVQTSAGTQTIDSSETNVPMPESNTTIEAKYDPKDVEMSYSTTREVLDGDTPREVEVSGSTDTVKFDSHVSATVADVDPEPGYSVAYYYNGVEVPDGEIGDKLVDSEDPITVTVKYKLNKYSLKYSVNSVEVSDDELYFTQATTAPDEADVEANVPVGFSFEGWDVEVPATMPANDVTVNAVLSAIDYTLTYVLDVDKFAEPQTAATYTLHYGDAIPTIDTPQREGYTFQGWDNVPSEMPAEDVVIRGRLTINTYHFALYVDGEVYFEKDYEYGEAIDTSEIVEPSKEGYTFQGWDPEIPQTVPASDVEINAVFTINQYTIEYYVDDVLYTSQTLDYGAELVAIDEPEKEGYTFSGWSEIPATMPVGGVRVDGTFQINSYILSYYVDGELVESAETEYNAQITAKAEPTKVGYTFSGWSDIPETMPAHDVRIDGTFTVNRWAIRYFVDGEEYFVDEHDYGDDITIIAIPEPKVGYTFSGWTYDEIPATMPDHDIEVNGVFVINTHTFTFYLDGEVYSSITADYGTTGITIENPTAETGYHFDGWKNSEGDAVAVPDTMPDEDLSFYGTIEINIHIASYYVTDENGNRALNSQTEFEYGATITYPEVQVPDGYALKWTKEHSTMPDMDIDIEGRIEEVVESKTIYYGTVPVTGMSEFNDFQSLSTYEYENGVSRNVAFVIPSDPEWEEVQYYTNRKKNNWIAAHMYDFYFMAPENTSVEFANSLGPYDYYEVGTFDIDGNSYKAYHADGQSPVTTDETYEMIIKITKN